MPPSTVSSSAAPKSSLPSWHRIVGAWRPDPIAWAIAMAGATLFICFSVAQWSAFVSPSWDLGIFTQLAQRYAHFQAPIVDIKGPGYNLLGDHFHPILVVLGPLFRLFPSGLTLLVLQGLLFAWSSVPLTRLARVRIGRVWGSLLGVGYILSWGLAGAIAAQFHEIAFAVPLLAFGLVHWLEGKHRAACIEIGLLVFVKEDLGLTVAAFGLVLLWLDWGHAAEDADGVAAECRGADRESHSIRQMNPDDGKAATENFCPDGSPLIVVPFPRRTWASLRPILMSWHSNTGARMVVWGVLWFVVSIAIILPLLNPNGSWDYTNRLSESQEAAPGILGFLTGLLGPGEKMVTLILLAFCAGLVGLRSPLIWLMAPTLAWRFAGNVSYYWGWQWHYSAILMPIAVVALLDGVERTRSHVRLRQSWRRMVVPVAVLCSAVPNFAMSWDGPVGSFLRGINDFHSVDRVAAQNAIDMVGSGSAVVSDIRMLAYVIPGNTVYWEGTVGDAIVDTIVVGPGHDALKDPLGPELWASSRFGGDWVTAFLQSDFLVLKRN